MADFTGAARDYLRVKTAQVLALKNGEDVQFLTQVEAARERKEAAKQAVVLHRKQHGC